MAGYVPKSKKEALQAVFNILLFIESISKIHSLLYTHRLYKIAAILANQSKPCFFSLLCFKAISDRFVNRNLLNYNYKKIYMGHWTQDPREIHG